MSRSRSARVFGAAQWQLVLPYVALALFLGLIGTLVWLTRSHDADNQRSTLINDVLWLEQNLRFLFDRNAAHLAQLGPELADATLSTATEGKLRRLLTTESGLNRIILLDAEGKVRAARPPMSEDHLIGESSGAVPAESIFRLARSLGRPVYGPTYEIAGGSHHFEVHVPIYTGSGLTGVIVGIYSLQDLIARESPWWFSERYRVSVTDADGRELAAKSRVAPLSNALAYTIAFDPPGHGLMLQITAYQGALRWTPILLAASIVLLAAIIVWSIWQLRRQLLRRQTAEQALRRETQFRKAMEDSLLTGLRARDLSGKVTYVNPSFCQMVGFDADELIGHMPPMPYWDPELLDRTQEIHNLILAGNAPREGVELQLRRKDGSRIDAMIFEAPLIDSEGRHAGWMGSVLDITEQKRAREFTRQQEERLQATSRLVTMGEMASTLAHELNQPLAAISSYNSGCLNRLSDDDIDVVELRDIHEKIARQAKRAGEIVRRVHAFVRRSEPKRELVDLAAILRDAVALMEADINKRVMTVQLDLGDRLPDIEADPLMIEQVIVNLVRNAMDAMRDNPRDRRTVTISSREEDGHYVIRVTDQGNGIPPDIAQHLFEPFYTTKQEGMGMGLNICRSIAELHHGRLGFKTEPNAGTVFILSLPMEPS